MLAFARIVQLHSHAVLQKEEELHFAVGAAVADLALSGTLFHPSAEALDGMHASGQATRRGASMQAGDEDAVANVVAADGKSVDALDFVLPQVGSLTQLNSFAALSTVFW